MNKATKMCAVLALLSLLLPISAQARGDISFTFYYDDREITIESTCIDMETAQQIADYIAYGLTPAGYIEPVNSMNTPILCVIFGHSLETTTAIETIHNVYTTSPKCVLNEYDVVRCIRENCDYIQKTLVYSTRISYCHG